MIAIKGDGNMSQILVRNLEAKVVERLKRRAKEHGRSLGGEARQILTQSAGMSRDEAIKMVRQWQKKLSGRKFPDTTRMIREDRNR
jgi:plasmid stability protein